MIDFLKKKEKKRLTTTWSGGEPRGMSPTPAHGLVMGTGPGGGGLLGGGAGSGGTSSSERSGGGAGGSGIVIIAYDT